MDTIDKLIKALNEAKEELSKNTNMMPGPQPNMAKEEQFNDNRNITHFSGATSSGEHKTPEEVQRDLEATMMAKEEITLHKNGQWELHKKHVGFKNLEHKLEEEGHSKESAGNIAYAVGEKKYGKAGMEHKAHAAHKSEDEVDKGEGWDKMERKLEREGHSKESADRIAGAINAKYVHHYRKSEDMEKDAADPKLAPKEVKIKEIQGKIDAGKYKPDSGKIADAMIKHPSKPLAKSEDLDKANSSVYNAGTHPMKGRKDPTAGNFPHYDYDHSLSHEDNVKQAKVHFAKHPHVSMNDTRLNTYLKQQKEQK